MLDGRSVVYRYSDHATDGDWTLGTLRQAWEDAEERRRI